MNPEDTHLDVLQNIEAVVVAVSHPHEVDPPPHEPRLALDVVDEAPRLLHLVAAREQGGVARHRV